MVHHEHHPRPTLWHYTEADRLLVEAASLTEEAAVLPSEADQDQVLLRVDSLTARAQAHAILSTTQAYPRGHYAPDPVNFEEVVHP